MVNLTNVQGALLDSIIRQTKELMDAIEENRIYDAGRLYSQRNHNMELLSTIKTSDLSKLNNISKNIISSTIKSKIQGQNNSSNVNFFPAFVNPFLN